MKEKDNRKCKIYILKNNINGKIYIGQTWISYAARMGRGTGYSNSPYIYGAIKKYGYENFEYETLVETDTQEEANAYEDYYINLYNSKNHKIGYNLKEGGVAGRHSEETKRKIAQNVPRFWKGKHLSEETKQKISESKKGTIRTEEAKQQTAETMKEWHKNNEHPMKGKHHSEEAKQKISEAGMGRKFSEESLQKRVNSRRDLELEAQVIKDHLDGMSIREIQKKYKIGGFGKIYRIFEYNGLRDKKYSK